MLGQVNLFNKHVVFELRVPDMFTKHIEFKSTHVAKYLNTYGSIQHEPDPQTRIAAPNNSPIVRILNRKERSRERSEYKTVGGVEYV